MIINNTEYDSKVYAKVEFVVMDTKENYTSLSPLYNLMNYINEIQSDIKINFVVSEIHVNDSREYGLKFGYQHGYKFEAKFSNPNGYTLDMWLESVFRYAKRLSGFCGLQKVKVYITLDAGGHDLCPNPTMQVVEI